jgi:NADPH:quinone reductase-like Zn-dependent oxidoreductase
MSMRALQITEYGGPEVLRITDVPEPHAGPGEIRIRVKAASINPIDWKTRSGAYASGPLTERVTLGSDGAGVVDEVGDGVTDVAVGDEVFGIGNGTQAEYAILVGWGRKPASMSWAEAGALGVAVETAARCLDAVDVRDGSTVLIDGAAGGVGSATVQLAVARGATVIGTASTANHDFLRSLGAVPTTYGEGLAERVAELAPQGVDAAIDTVGKGSVPELIAIVGDASRVVSIADRQARELGAKLSSGMGGEPRATYALGLVAKLYEEGRFTVPVAETFGLDAADRAHELSERGHVRGKLVFLLD